MLVFLPRVKPCSSPQIDFKKVLHPEPGRPRTASSSPLLSKPLKPWRICLCCLFRENSSPTRSGASNTESTLSWSCRAEPDPKTSRSEKRTPSSLDLCPSIFSSRTKFRTHFVTSKSADSGFRAESDSNESGLAMAWDRCREIAVAIRWSSVVAPSSRISWRGF